MLRPVVPTVGLVVRELVLRHLLDQVVFSENHGVSFGARGFGR
jgi:hypothetical protein